MQIKCVQLVDAAAAAAAADVLAGAKYAHIPVHSSQSVSLAWQNPSIPPQQQSKQTQTLFLGSHTPE